MRSLWWNGPSSLITEPGDVSAMIRDDVRQPIIFILSMLEALKLRLGPLETGPWWHRRSMIGSGAISTVETAEIPVPQNPDYRDPTIQQIGASSAFTDRRNVRWDWGTQVAYKFAGKPGQSMKEIARELCTELCIWCHPSLADDPNIAQLLGVAWTSGEAWPIQQEPKDSPTSSTGYPIIVLERAHCGDLYHLLHERRHTETSLSLLQKFRICVDVLRALQTLHANEIFHGDIKCKNVLIFKNTEGNFENYTARLSDFSHSKIGGQKTYSSGDICGTLLYCPPELLDRESMFQETHLPSIDIWCWGMLVWEVITDGHAFEDPDDQPLDPTKFEWIKKHGKTQDRAFETINDYIEQNYAETTYLKALFLDCVKRSLATDAAHRWKASDLLRSIDEDYAEFTDGHRLPRAFTNPPISLFTLTTPFPFFELENMYYTLLPLEQIHRLVFQELEEITVSGDHDPRYAQANYQLGLCYAVGFGTSTNQDSAIKYIKEAASPAEGEGLIQARISLYNMVKAWGTNFDRFDLNMILEWQRMGSMKGSGVASRSLLDAKPTFLETSWVSTAAETSQPLQREVSETLETLTGTVSPPTPDQTTLDSSLLAAARRGSFEAIRELVTLGASVNFRGQYGETALHYVSLLHGDDLVPSLALLLLQQGANQEIYSTKPMPLSSQHLAFNEMPSDKSPLQWAIALDNVPFLHVMLERSDCTLKFYFLRDACLHRSINSILYMKGLPNFNVVISQRDGFGLSVLYYVVRPDYLRHILTFRESRPITLLPGHSPLISQTIQLLEILINAGSSWELTTGNSFNVLHLLAAYGESQLLEALLNRWNLKHLINQTSKYGWTPIKDAIARGHDSTFRILLQHGADLRNVWPEQYATALHICASRPSGYPSRLAEEILQHDRSLIKSEDLHSHTVLHTAASRGNIELLRLFLDRGADLLAFNGLKLTPLGTAIYYRSVGATQLLVGEHNRWKVPCDVSYVKMWRFTSNSALHFILTPGAVTPTPIVQHTWLRTDSHGTFDYPFSRVSKEIVQILLGNHSRENHGEKSEDQQSSRFVDRLKYSWRIDLWLHPYYIWHKLWPYLAADWLNSGMDGASTTWNHEAIKMIVDSGRFKLNFEYWCFYAAVDRTGSRFRNKMSVMDIQHRDVWRLSYVPPISSIQLRRVRGYVIEYLCRLQRMQYLDLREARCRSLLRSFWRVFYSLYGDPRQRLLEEAIKWSEEDLHKSKPYMFEFLPWPYTRFSYVAVNAAVLWCFLIPAIAFFMLIRGTEGYSDWWRETTPRMIGVFISSGMLSIWPVLWRLVALLFDQLLVTCQQPFTWRSRLRWLWQVFSSFLIPVGGIFTAYFASPDNWIYLQREVHEEWYSGLRPVPVLSTQLPQSVVRFKLMSQLLIAWLSMIVPAGSILFVAVLNDALKLSNNEKVEPLYRPAYSIILNEDR